MPTVKPDPAPRPSTVSSVMRPINAVVERFIPSALVFAVVLTFVVGIAALVLTDAGPVGVIKGWGDGLAGLLAFMTQMALILLLGHALAYRSRTETVGTFGRSATNTGAGLRVRFPGSRRRRWR